jgi:phenylacetate-CoA ligase
MLVTSNYGMSELMGPGVSGECEYLCGMHINEDYFIPEIIDPKTGQVLPEGEKGELVITCIKKEGLPLIRYRTKDITRLNYQPCKCGRTFCRMENLSGRADDMLKIRGVNVFPSQIETVLLNEGYQPNYQIIVDRVNNNDTFEVDVEMAPEQFTDRVGEILAKEKQLADAMKTMLGINPKVHLVAPKTIARSEGKAVRVIDKRKLI